MIINTLIPLSQADTLPARQVGKMARDFAALAKLKVKISEGFVIPVETIKRIAYHNDLPQKINLIEETADWEGDYAIKANLKKIRSLIAKQKIPGEIAQTLVKRTEKLLDKNPFLQVYSPKNNLENIRGTTNLLESILMAWGLDYVKGGDLTPPILVLAQSQPEASGVAKIDRSKKNLVLIKAVQGVYDRELGLTNQPDVFEINLSSMTIISRHLHPRKTLLKRQLDGLKTNRVKPTNQAALTDDQALKIAGACQVVNRQALGRRKLYFEVAGGKVTVTKIFEPSTKTVQDAEPELVLLGQSVTGGYIEGSVQVVTTPQQVVNFNTGGILVKKSLDHLDHSLVLKASALVLEDKTLTPAALKLINEHHLPCVIGVAFATVKLRSGQKIIVDAGAGKLLKPISTAQPITTSHTITKVYLSAGNPYKLDHYPSQTEGIFLKSDYAIAFVGVHPNHLLKTKKQTFFDQLSRAIAGFLQKNPDHFFYRACNLNSQELSSLKNSGNYEKSELNPYLGTRGALKILEDQTLFAAELQIVNRLASSQKKSINFVLPWVRTATELAILFKKIDQIVPEHPYLKFWLQLNTPANVLNLSEYLRFPISGLAIQAKTIHDLVYGLDPDNPELDRAYTFDTRLMTTMIRGLVETVKQTKLYTSQVDRTLPIVLKLNHYHSELVTTAAQLGLRAVVVKPALFAIVKQQIIATQNQILK